ncbi:MAG: hypothetical protein JYX80_08850 [Candidatus Scalindua sediminis]|nr:hypothetical protein [Candidatus Scalindua sediminis]
MSGSEINNKSKSEIGKEPVSIFDAWSKQIAKVISAESTLAGNGVTHGGMIGNAREAIIRNVLNRFIPTGYEIGSGQIIDHKNNLSKQIDIVIARRDFPSLLRFDGTKLYTVESVVATIEIKSVLDSNSLPEALDNCYSVSELTNAVSGDIENVARKLGLTPHKHGFVHKSAIETARWECRYRPVSYILGLKGYKTRSSELKSAIYNWGSRIIDEGRPLTLKHFPSVICAEGCFAWRNDKPLSLEKNWFLLGGRDPNPLHLVVSHLLYVLYNRIPSNPDRDGVRPDASNYLKQMRSPEVMWKLFSATQPSK